MVVQRIPNPLTVVQFHQPLFIKYTEVIVHMEDLKWMGKAKITDEQKKFILDASHLSHAVLGRMFGISRQRVHQLRLKYAATWNRRVN